MFNKLYGFSRKISTFKSLQTYKRIRVTVKAIFGKYLLATNTISCGVLMLLGDLIQQEIRYDRHKCPPDQTGRYNYAQLTRMFIAGLALGPTHHYYYVYLNVLWPKRDLITVTKKILADQFIMSPICIAQFFYSMDLMEMKTIKQSTEELKEKFVTVYTMDWCVWPPTQFINFYFMPVKYQVIYINVVTMLYNVFLSYIKHHSLSKLSS